MLYLVDDAADYRFLVQQVFTRFLAQYPVRFFTDGLALIQFIEQSAVLPPVDSGEPVLVRPKLIVLDVDMPQLNGLQTLERLKQVPVWQAVPVVMMSNRIDPSFEAMASELGARSFLTKPVDIFHLKTAMEQLCQQWLEA